jgi:hypothetical protein
VSTRNLGLLVPREKSNVQDIHSWATVTQASPLRIKLDGETDPLPFTPDKIVSGLVLSDRVLVLLMANTNPLTRARRVVILGKAV